MTRRALALLLAATLPAGGCSWIFMTKPPPVVAAPNYPLDCSDSHVAPVFDSICAGYFALNGLVLASGYDPCRQDPSKRCLTSQQRGGGVGLSLGLLALCGASAWSGFHQASRCADMKVQNALCITGSDPACQALNPAWTRPPPAPPPGHPAQPPPQAAPSPPPPPSAPPPASPQ